MLAYVPSLSRQTFSGDPIMFIALYVFNLHTFIVIHRRHCMALQRRVSHGLQLRGHTAPTYQISAEMNNSRLSFWSKFSEFSGLKYTKSGHKR